MCTLKCTLIARHLVLNGVIYTPFPLNSYWFSTDKELQALLMPPLHQMGLLVLLCITKVDEPWRCNPFPLRRVYFTLQQYPAR